MSDTDELRTLDVRIATELFGWNPPPFGRPPLGLSRTSLPIIRPLTRYASDWGAIPLLLKQCAKRDWGVQSGYTSADSIWNVRLEYDDGGDDYNACDAEADTLQLALCKAIVAVLDALEETAEETKARES